MEDTLRGWLLSTSVKRVSLNPCFNGRYSQRKKFGSKIQKPNKGLNPCFNGRYSQRNVTVLKNIATKVLILVLMEDTLRVRI